MTADSQTTFELNLMLTSLNVQDFTDITQLLVHAAVKKGMNALSTDLANIFGMAPTVHHVRFGSDVQSILIPAGKCQVLVGFEILQATRVAGEYLAPGGVILLNRYFLRPPYVYPPFERCPDQEELLAMMRLLTDRIIIIDANAMARQVGDRDVVRFVMLGATVGMQLLPLSALDITETLQELMVDTRFLPLALEGFKRGLQAAEQLN